MRFRQPNHRKDNPEVFKKLVKTNPYIARVYDYPEFLIPHPNTKEFHLLFKKLNGNFTNHHSNVHLEIGCGSCRYLIEWALANPKDSFIGLELRYKRLALAAKKIKSERIQNILLLRERGEYFHEYFPKKGIDVLHINFPDPWPKKLHHKNRILSTDFLNKIYPYFSSKGELRFKTDHLEYFDTVIDILQKTKKFKIVDQTNDLHLSTYNSENILTEFELLFKSKGNPPIRYLKAVTQ